MDYIVDYQLNWSTRGIDDLDSTSEVSELNLKTVFMLRILIVKFRSHLNFSVKFITKIWKISTYIALQTPRHILEHILHVEINK